MDVDLSEDETMRQQLAIRSNGEGRALPVKLPRKSMVPLPRVQKGMKMITDAFKTPNLIAVLLN